MDGLKDRVAIVTGGATLIGAEVVRSFQAAGVKVVVADINDKDGQALAERLGSNVRFVKTDLADDGQITKCVEATVQAFGGIDFLVNLACVYIDNALESTRQEWLDSYNVNVVGGVLMLKAVRPHMVKRAALRRMGDPELDIGRALNFLIGPASRFVSGQTLIVSGGAMML